MRKKLLYVLVKNFCSSVILLIVLIMFSGTIKYVSGWITSIIYFMTCCVHHIVLFIGNRDMFLKRTDEMETNKLQRIIINIGGIYIFCLAIIAAISYKNNFLMLGLYRYLISFLIIMVAIIIYTNVLTVNQNLSATINNVSNQEIIQKGMYSIIRHPMYVATTLFVVGFCIMLGSLISLLLLILMIPLLTLRIINEEKVLLKHNIEYKNYMKKVKYRLVPFIW